MKAHPPRIVLSAGESSGDHLGADLARCLTARHPEIRMAGVAGPAMQEAGVEPWFDLESLNVMGLTEILAHLPRLIRFRRELQQRIIQWQPDAFVGIDAPDFNLGLARKLRRKGLKTVHYVSPTVWAWRGGRTASIARSVDLLLALFPFEPELYASHALKVRFVGHPLADQITPSPDREQVRAEFGYGMNETVIALLPGSRRSEIERHARLLAETALLLRTRLDHARLVMLLASPHHEQAMRELAGDQLDAAGVEIHCGRTRHGLVAANTAIVASGTATLEGFLLECPLVAYYRLAPATYWLIRGLRLIRSRYIAMPNILYGGELLPEFVQQQASPEQLSNAALQWLEDDSRRARYRQIARHHRRELAVGAGDNAAAAILELTGHDRDPD